MLAHFIPFGQLINIEAVLEWNNDCMVKAFPRTVAFHLYQVSAFSEQGSSTTFLLIVIINLSTFKTGCQKHDNDAGAWLCQKCYWILFSFLVHFFTLSVVFQLTKGQVDGRSKVTFYHGSS